MSRQRLGNTERRSLLIKSASVHCPTSFSSSCLVRSRRRTTQDQWPEHTSAFGGPPRPASPSWPMISETGFVAVRGCASIPYVADVSAWS